MSSPDSEIAGTRALYELHMLRIENIRTGASQHAYDDAQIAEFEREAQRLKALLDGFKVKHAS